ncbi:MAG: hypothetical protein ACLPKI_20755 [Streptosporangiaceae bacterium]
MSSAILYFAIVAIWAGVLMPRWLRPRHRADAEQNEPAGADVVASFAQPGLEAEDDGRRRAEAARRPRRAPDRPAERDPEPAAPWTEDDTAARRRNILRARRRMLGTLIVLTVGAIAIAVTHVAAWWVTVPPGVLLGGFLLLLREAARSDQERARREAAQAGSQQAADPQAAGPPAAEPEVFERIESAPEAPEADVVEITATAEIIDISARVSEQVYDQYIDAAERAVGD